MGGIDEVALGNTPLKLAVYLGNVDTVKALLETGASLEAVDENGLTPREFATKLLAEDEGNADVLKVLKNATSGGCVSSQMSAALTRGHARSRQRYAEERHTLTTLARCSSRRPSCEAGAWRWAARRWPCVARYAGTRLCTLVMEGGRGEFEGEFYYGGGGGRVFACCQRAL